ncbi:sporulation protein [Paenibacillus sp. 481]|uniref:sporulation protein n=1 Tax=Paenibacillus sp. 481 TaxID=2835869 RepID=UPI001E5D56BE|nr:sporulation protein [Paenibacillus sp. 481]UHA75014.1 sporulation protein [Paenibacillus sp. 481]
MSMFNRMLASIGIGSAKVDTLLEKARYAPGEEVRGVVKLNGGQVAQQIDGIRLQLMSQYVKEVDDRKTTYQHELARFRVSDAFSIQASEAREIPFSFILPSNVPLTIGTAPVWLKTELDIPSAIDPTDNDRIEVVPTVEQSIIIDGVNRLGFRLRKAECEYAARLGGSLPFVQEFEFVPTSHFRGDLDELEIMFFTTEQGIELLIQIDRRARGFAGLFAEAMDMDETFVRYRRSLKELRELGAEGFSQELADIIRRHL